METRLYQLLESKSFDELNAEEKEYVLGIMSQTEYENSHALVNKTQTAFSEVREAMEPDAAVFKELKTVFKEKYGRKPKSEIFDLGPILEVFSAHKKWSLAGLAVLIATGFAIIQFSTDSEVEITAMDISKIENFSEMNKHLYLDDIYMEPDTITPIDKPNEME